MNNLSRRRFLSDSVIAAAVLSAGSGVPSHVFAAEEKAPAKKTTTTKKEKVESK